jgi:hypothetical protein
MQIFVSWSGEDSRQAAQLMKDWLPNVLQSAKVWVSSHDIAKGEKWSESLSQSLQELNYGILMITKTNVAAPWILFEAGALSKSVQSRVIPILCNLPILDVAGSPIAQFQSAVVKKDDMFSVVEAINGAISEQLDPERLKRTFDLWWPSFEDEFSKIKFKDTSKKRSEKSEDVRLENIENAVEAIMRSIQRLQRPSISSQKTSRISKDETGQGRHGFRASSSLDELARLLTASNNKSRSTDEMQLNDLSKFFSGSDEDTENDA